MNSPFIATEAYPFDFSANRRRELGVINIVLSLGCLPDGCRVQTEWFASNPHAAAWTVSASYAKAGRLQRPETIDGYATSEFLRQAAFINAARVRWVLEDFRSVYQLTPHDKTGDIVDSIYRAMTPPHFFDDLQDELSEIHITRLAWRQMESLRDAMQKRDYSALSRMLTEVAT
jgi:hypothetical protein